MNFRLFKIILVVFSLSLFDVAPSFACKKTYTLKEGIPFSKQISLNTAKTYVIRSRFDLSNEEVILPRGCVLLFENGGMVVGGKLIGNQTELKRNGSNAILGKDLLLAGDWTNKEIDVTWWDCYADGKRDDYVPLHNISRSVSEMKKVHLVFPKEATYLVNISFCGDRSGSDKRDFVFDFSRCDVDIQMNGTTIKVAPNGYTRYTLFMFRNNSIFSIANGHLIGDRMEHDYSATYYPRTHEFCFGIDVMGSVGAITNMDVEQFPGDGIRVFNDYDWFAKRTISLANTIVKDCSIHHNRRQGISVADCGEVLIENCRIFSIGDSDNILGTAPKAAIDLEFESGEGVAGKIIVRDCTFTNCNGGSVVTGSRNKKWDSIAVYNCKMTNAMPSFINQGGGIYDVHDLEIYGSNKDAFRTVFNLPDNLYSIHVNSSQYLNLSRKTYLKNCSFMADNNQFYISMPEGAFFEGCTFEGLKGQDGCKYIPGITYFGGFNLYNGGKTTPAARFVNCVIKESGFFLNGKKDVEGNDFCQLEFEKSTLQDVFFNDINAQSFSFKNCKIKNVDSRYQVVKKVEMRDCEFEDVRGSISSGFCSANLSMNNTIAKITKNTTSWVKSHIRASRSNLSVKVIGDKDKAIIEAEAGSLETNLPIKQIVSKRGTKVVRTDKL